MRIRAALLLLALLLPAFAGAAECPVAPDMRRTHMDRLAHDRSAAAREGVRLSGRGLQDCVDCHAVRDGDVAVDAADPRHFCTACHVRAAVAVDCFTCHCATPAEARR